jgi:hypothetical protein
VYLVNNSSIIRKWWFLDKNTGDGNCTHDLYAENVANLAIGFSTSERAHERNRTPDLQLEKLASLASGDSVSEVGWGRNRTSEGSVFNGVRLPTVSAHPLSQAPK